MQPESNGSAASYTNGSSLSGKKPVSSTFFGHDRAEVTRILIQSLGDLGYHSAAAALSKESGCELEGPTVAAFRNAVLQGKWADAEALLFGHRGYDNGGGVDLDGHESYGKSSRKASRLSWPSARIYGGLTLAEGANKDEMKFWMRQQKYLELLEARDLGNALMVLRQELTPLHQDTSRLHALSSLMMCLSVEELKAQAQWDGANGESRTILLSELSKSISPSVMIPEHRLADLLSQVKQSWISNCLYHNTSVSPSLYVDHTCDREDFPLTAVHELRDHKDEVWFLKYSHDGTMLATTSKDHSIVIYETETYKPIHYLEEHEDGVCYVAWSPDDSKIITCCSQQESSARIWDVKTGDCQVCISDFTYTVTTAEWAPNGEGIVIGSQDTKYGLALWDTAGNLVHKWNEEIRVHDLAITADGSRLAVLLESRILVYDFVTKEKIGDWMFDDVKMTSVTMSQDCQHMLISMIDSKIMLMDIDTGEVVQRYANHIQTQYIIRSSFGGADESFVVSGSEDSRIYIWRTNGRQVEVLEAHSGCVNAVAWHPKDPRCFASAGDDHKVKIWRPTPHDHHPSSPNGSTR